MLDLIVHFRTPPGQAGSLWVTRSCRAKTHGSAGDFEIDLLPPAPGIECREGQPSAGAHKIVFTFAVPVTFTTADCGGSGNLNSGEIALVKSKSGTALP